MNSRARSVYRVQCCRVSYSSAAGQWLCIVELEVSTGYNVAGCSSAAGQWLGAE